MRYQFRNYKESDFLLIRDFISNTYFKLKKPNSWLIDRWEFCYYYLEKRNEKIFKEWLCNIGIWKNKKGSIEAIVVTDGDIYFILDTTEPSNDLINELFDYTEKRLLKFKNGILENCLAIPVGMQTLETIAINRGYKKQDFNDTFVSINIDKEFKVDISNEYKIKDGNEVSDINKGLGHVMAFNYPDTEKAELSINIFQT